MSLKVTITIEGDADEIRLALPTVLGLQGSSALGIQDEHRIYEASLREQSRIYASEWQETDLVRLWQELKPEARRIWAEIAMRPNGYGFAELEAKLGIGGLNIAGRMSSMGHAIKRLFPGRKSPLVRDYSVRRYRMSPDVALIIRRLYEAAHAKTQLE